jgi:LacI family transcriptional regulator
MRNRVLDAVAAVGYEPNLLARSLRSGPTKTVGIVLSDISNPLTAQIALGAERAAQAAGYTVLLTNSTNRSDLDASHIRLLRQRRADGLILQLADDRDSEAASLLSADGVPLVFVDRSTEQVPRASAVISDHAVGMAAAVVHLISLGHRHIALVNGSVSVRPARERAAALRRASKERKDVTATVRSGDFGAEHGLRATLDLLQGPEPPTAIIAGGNQIFVGVLQAIRKLHLRLPQDVSLVTCDDVPLAKLFDPPISTISRDPEEMGRVAIELLLEQMRGGQPRTVVLGTTFQPDASCGFAPAHKNRVARNRPPQRAR